MKKRSFTRNFVFIMTLVVFLGSLSLSFNKPSLAPDFILKDLSGNDIELSDFREKVLFLNFWAMSCAPCRREIPGFVEMYEKYKKEGMEILGISLDILQDQAVARFAKMYNISYPLAMGNNKVIADYQPGLYIPVTIIIDKKGTIRDRHVGYMDKRELERYFLFYSKE